MPGAVAPRIMVWAAAILTAPVTGGASLLGIGVYEGGIARERRRAAYEIDRLTPLENDTEHIIDAIEHGAKEARVESTHYLGHMQLGHVRRDLMFKEEETD